MGIGIAGLYILVHVRILRPPVQHADFLPLIQKGCSLLEQVGHRQGLSAFIWECLAAVAGDDPGVIVVFDVEHIPCLVPQLVLPLGEGFFHAAQREFGGQVVRKQAIGALTLELDHHIDLTGLLMDILQRPFGPYQRRFCQGEAIIVIEHIALEFFQIFMDVGAVVVVAHAFVNGENVIVRQAFFFGDVGDHILTEAVHSHVQPKAQDRLDLLPNQRMIHVQIRLLHRKQVQIVFSADFVIGPGLALEIGIPVVGQLAISGRAPDIVIGVGLDSLAALLKPLMLIAGVVHHQIHDQLHATVMAALQHFFEGLHTAEFRRDVHIVCDIIAAVCARRGVDGRKPDAIAA